MLTDDELIAGLRQYISKNTVIPAFFHRLEAGQDPDDSFNLTRLKTAVAEANPNDAIFSNQYCSLYLLYLIEQKQMPFWQGMTVYFYCIALMQFTEKQSLRESDARYKIDQSVTVHFLMKEGVLTPEGEKYLNHIEKRYASFPMLKFNREALLAQMSAFGLLDQWLIQIDGRGASALPGYEQARSIILDDVLYLARYSAGCFVVPSFSLMQLLHKMQCDQPMTFKPLLGSISRETLVQFRKQDNHPLPLYSPFVKNNLMKVHQYDCGPFFVVLHDVAHCFMANFLSFKERQMIVFTLVPQLKTRFTEIEGLNQKAKFSGAIERAAFEWYDFNLSKIENMPRERSEWLMFHLVSTFGRYHYQDTYYIGLYASLSPQFKDYPRGFFIDDDLLYYLGVMANGGEVWRELFDRMYALAETRRGSQALAEIMAAVNESKPKPALSAMGLFAVSKAPESALPLLPLNIKN